MLPRTITLSCLCSLLLLVVMTTGCMRNTPFFSEPATIVSSRYFTATQNLPQPLLEKLPSDIIFYIPKDAGTGYYSPKQFSTIAFNNLSLNFLWTGEQHNLPVDGTTYAAMPSAGQTATFNGTELIITSEFSQENLALLAILDWDDTGSKDWLVSYSFKSLVQPETSTRLLLVRNIVPGRVLTASVLSATECYGNKCEEFVGGNLSQFLEYQPLY